ncbi:cyclase [Kribbella sancticallisti]|uniref:Cyclase n=1 Tax=Kribbella sancticallisti TaxID=460087 RepID=A0ABN2CFZ7_9ACTN
MTTHCIMMWLRKSSVLAVALFPAVTVPAAASPQPAVPGVPTASYACRADTKFGRQTFSLRQGVDAKAPATVTPGARFTIAVDLKPGSLPGEVKGFKLKEVRDLSLRIPIPNNTSYVSARLTGGSGLGSTPTLERNNGVLTVRVSGPIPGGATYQLPSLSVRLKAGARGKVIETRLQGTSFDNPGLNLQATIKWKFVTLKSPVACYPDPNPALTRTTIR